MDQLRKLYSSLSVTQRVGILAAVILFVAGVASFVRWRHESDFRPLFTGMAAEDAAAIVQKLKESGVEHRITDNGASVLVPAAKLDELRLEMAGAGLPRTGRIGFELFDKTNLGITDFTEHVNYRRALEGELERSIRSLNVVEQARVHISSPRESVVIQLGAYVSGSNPRLDTSIRSRDQILGFLRQDAHETAPLTDTLTALSTIASSL